MVCVTNDYRRMWCLKNVANKLAVWENDRPVHCIVVQFNQRVNQMCRTRVRYRLAMPKDVAVLEPFSVLSPVPAAITDRLWRKNEKS